MPPLTYREGDHFAMSKHLGEGGAEGPPLEVRIPAEFVTAANRQVRARQLWGTDVYTEDSDLVAVLVHAGFYALPTTAAAPPPGLVELRATLRPLPAQEAGYASTARHGIRSRAWGGGCRAGGAPGAAAYRVEKCVAALSGGHTAVLDPAAWRAAPGAAATFMLGASERSVHTRGSETAARRGGRFSAEVTLLFSLSNEPWLKYSVAAVADRGLKRAAWTSARMRREVLFLETRSERFQLHWEGLSVPDDAAAQVLDAYTFAKCVQPLDLGATRAAGVPLPASAVRPLARGVAWEAIRWGLTGVSVAGVHYPVIRLLFLPTAKPEAA